MFGEVPEYEVWRRARFSVPLAAAEQILKLKRFTVIVSKDPREDRVLRQVVEAATRVLVHQHEQLHVGPLANLPLAHRREVCVLLHHQGFPWILDYSEGSFFLFVL